MINQNALKEIMGVLEVVILFVFLCSFVLVGIGAYYMMTTSTKDIPLNIILRNSYSLVAIISFLLGIIFMKSYRWEGK